MDTDDWLQLRRTFDELVTQDADTRDSRLEALAITSPELHAELVQLLAAHQGDRQIEDAVQDAAKALHTPNVHQDLRVGAYLLEREIGSGGMGSVWLAARNDDVYEGQVAIKLMHALPSEALLNRFMEERRILATLNHINIARLLDGGTTDDGQPYVVMEYVDGVPIDQYCNRHSLNLEHRLRLFRSVCAGVEHAHRNLVIHRDLKPENVLINEDGEAKLLDFGIAKLIGTDQKTIEGQRLFTPHYASPEQIRGKSITQATDIYALGVLLNKLLTGQSPYEGDLSDPIKLARDIAATSLKRPSERVALNNPQLSQQLKGDLDNIVLKALRKQPENRYSTVSDLSDDVLRHLEKRPIKARPATVTYTLSRFVSRHWIGSVAALVVIALLSIAAIFSFDVMRSSNEAREQASLERSVAAQEVLRTTLISANTAIDEADAIAASRLLNSVVESDRGWEWNYLSARMKQSVATIPASTAVAAAVAENGTGIWLIDTKGELTQWRNNTLTNTYSLTDRTIIHADFSIDSRRLSVLLDNNFLELWELDTSTPTRLWQTQVSPGSQLVRADLDGNRIAIAGSGVSLYSGEGNLVNRWQSETPVEDLVLSSDGTHFATISLSGREQKFQVRTDKGAVVTEALGGGLLGMALSHDGQRIASSGSDVVRIRTSEGFRVIERLYGHSVPPTAMAFNADSQQLWTTGADRTLRRWNKEGELELVLFGHNDTVRFVSSDESGRYAVTLSDDGTARLWDSQRNEAVPSMTGHWATFSHADSLITLDQFGAFSAHDTNAALRYDMSVVGDMRPQALFGSDSGKWMGVEGLDRVDVFDPMFPHSAKTLHFTDEEILSSALNPEGSVLAVALNNSELGFYSLKDNRNFRIALEVSENTAIAWSPDGGRLAVTLDNSIQILRTDGSLVSTLSVETSQPTSITWHPTGQSIAIGFADGQIQLRTIEGTAIAEPLSQHTGQVGALAFSPDGLRLASGAADRMVWLWDATTGRALFQIDDLKGDQSGSSIEINSVAFSKNGQHLAAATTAGTVKLWSTTISAQRQQAVDHMLAFVQKAEPLVLSTFARSANVEAVTRRLRDRTDFESPHARRAALRATLSPPDLPLIEASPFGKYALEFSDDDDHVLVSSPERLRMQKKFTVEAWIKPQPFGWNEAPHSLRMVFNKEGEYQVAIDPDGRVYWIMADKHGWLGWADTRYFAPFGKWSHIALVRDINRALFYIDGTLVQELSIPTTIGDQHPYKNEFRIGGRQHTPSSFRGQIAMVRIWSSARSQEQLVTTMSQQTSPDDSSLLAAWYFEENDSTTLSEFTKRHPGKIVGASRIAIE